MTTSKTRKLIVDEPWVHKLADYLPADITGRSEFTRTYVDPKFFGKETPAWVSWVWTTAVPSYQPIEREHAHEFDEVLLFIGSDAENPDDLGGTAEISLDGEKHVINKTSAIFIPKGMKHCPLFRTQVNKPWLLIAIEFGKTTWDGKFTDGSH